MEVTWVLCEFASRVLQLPSEFHMCQADWSYATKSTEDMQGKRGGTYVGAAQWKGLIFIKICPLLTGYILSVFFAAVAHILCCRECTLPW